MAHGGARKGAGRKPKAVEKTIKEYTEPHIAEAVATLVGVLTSAERDSDRIAAAKILLSYGWGMPKQQTDVNLGGINIPISNWDDNKE